jgi:hypothetical protein
MKKKIMPRRTKKIGNGATTSCFVRFLHPSALIRAKYINNYKDARISDLNVLGREVKTVSRKPTDCALVQHNEFPGQIFHVALKKLRVDEEGPESEFWNDDNEGEGGQAHEAQQDEEENPIQEAVARHGVNLEEGSTRALHAQGIEVDDDDEPAPENVPASNDGQVEIFSSSWGFEGIDFRRQMQVPNFNASMNGMTRDGATLLNPLQFFLIFFPINHIKDVIIKAMNQKHNLEISYGEFLVYLGLRFLFATCQKCDLKEFWSKEAPTLWSSAPFRVNSYMPRRRFEDISSALSSCLTDEPSPPFLDPYHRVRQLIDAWNENMTEKFSPSWISVLDESMSVWTSKYSCPGWMVVPRKPHPFGNEYHTVACAKSGVLWQVELVEGKDRPRQLGPPEFHDLGKTVGLMLRLTRPIWHTGKHVVMDSGFCVLKGIIEMRKKGVFGAALIKKRRYWPKFIPGDELDRHFDDKDVGFADAIKGVFDQVPFYIFAMKEPDYVMKIMATGGSLIEMPDGGTSRTFKQSNGTNTTIQFNYREPFYNHFRYRHQIDDHNNRRHSPLSFEECWATHQWPVRVFAFLLAVSEVNAKLAFTYFHHDSNKTNDDMIGFRRKLVQALLQNEWFEREDESSPEARPKRKRIVDHELLRPPKFTGKFVGNSWTRVTTKYLQRNCGCGERTRTFCSCDKTVFYCLPCFANHLKEVE